MTNVFALAETRAGELRKAALETVTAARQIADRSGGEVHALLCGPPGIASSADRLAAYGADVVLVCEHAAFSPDNPEAVAAVAAERVRGGYVAAVFSASAQGRDVAPRVAGKLGRGLASDVIGIEGGADGLLVRHPMNTGKVIATVRIAGTPALLSVRPGSFAPLEQRRAGRVERVAPPTDPSASRVRVTELVAGDSTRPDLGEAPIIVSGGRGLKGPENFKLVEELAEALGNAAVGATRAVTDDGWRPHSDQIGQTGRLVSPNLYIAVGISGAIQHLAGMRTSRTIVAINKDREAPIFKIADYGIVGDALEIVPALTAAVREARRNSGL
jgi:electron transfer flavoprotein alpha subunit